MLSLLLCFVLAAGLLSVCAPPAQAGTIAGAFEQFIKQPGQIKKLFGNEVAHGDCGPAGDEASVHYKIYEVTNPTVVQDNPFLQQIWQIHDYREDAQYYGVYIFGDGPMADYAVKGQKAPWMGNVEVTEYNDKGQKLGTTVVETSARTISSWPTSPVRRMRSGTAARSTTPVCRTSATAPSRTAST